MSALHARRIAYLMARLKAGQGHQAVIVEEITKAHNQGRNADRMRRASDVRIQGWAAITGAESRS